MKFVTKNAQDSPPKICNEKCSRLTFGNAGYTTDKRFKPAAEYYYILDLSMFLFFSRFAVKGHSNRRRAVDTRAQWALANF